MSFKKETTWYVEPIGELTNRSVVQLLGQDASESEDRVFVKDVGSINVYRVPHRIITQMNRTKGLNFHIYHQKGDGEVSKWYFPKKKSPKKAATAKI